MNHSPLAYAEAYYKSMAAKNMAEVAHYLHPEVRFLSPVASLTGKVVVLEAAERFSSFFNNLTIRAKFESGNQAMVVYNVDFPEPIGISRAAALMTVEEGLITHIELFFDASPFKQK
jgi:hypothetical protein